MHSVEMVAAMFGPSAGEVLQCYRRAHHTSQLLSRLESTLDQLHARHDTLRSENQEEIARRFEETVLAEQALEEKKRLLGDLVNARDKLEQRIGSVWRRLGITLLSFLGQLKVGVGDIRRQLESMGKQLHEREDAFDRASGQLDRRRRAVQCLTVPLESLDFAIGFLDNRRHEATAESAELQSRLDEVIGQMAQAASPEILRLKLQSLAEIEDTETLQDDLIELQRALLTLESLRPVLSDDDVPVAEVVQDPGDLARAIQAGLYQETAAGNGRVNLSGDGTKHVRKTRTRTETFKRSDGTIGTRTRRETYWDKVRIRFSGTVGASFAVELARWRKDDPAAALHNEAKAAFHRGLQQARETCRDEIAEPLRQTVARLTRRIREYLDHAPR